MRSHLRLFLNDLALFLNDQGLFLFVSETVSKRSLCVWLWWLSNKLPEFVSERPAVIHVPTWHYFWTTLGYFWTTWGYFCAYLGLFLNNLGLFLNDLGLFLNDLGLFLNDLKNLCGRLWWSSNKIYEFVSERPGVISVNCKITKSLFLFEKPNVWHGRIHLDHSITKEAEAIYRRIYYRKS